MEKDTSYVPCSAKATDFSNTLLNGAKEDEERVSFIKQQIQQATDSYDSALENVIEECIALEIQAAKKEESQLIMDLSPAITTAIQKLQGSACNKHLQTVNAHKMMPTLLEFGPIENINNFLMFYQTHHSLDDVPNSTIRTMNDEYPMVEAQTNAMHFHTISLQRTENKGIQLYRKCLESILTTPTASYNKQVEENQRLLNLKKLSNEIILFKSTEDTAMELDGEGVTNYELLKDLIRKECDKQDCKYARLQDKYNKLEQQVTHKDHTKTWHKGADRQTPKEQPPQRKTNLPKNKAKPHKTTVQKTRFQANKINQSEEIPKTKETLSTKTMIHGQTT